VPWVLSALPVRQVPKDHKASQVLPAQQVPKVLLVHKVLQVPKVLPARRELLVRPVLLGHKVYLDRLVCRDCQGLLALLVLLEQQALKVHKANKVYKV